MAAQEYQGGDRSQNTLYGAKSGLVDGINFSVNSD